MENIAAQTVLTFTEQVPAEEQFSISRTL